jgi:excisionase family DNA binding protein
METATPSKRPTTNRDGAAEYIGCSPQTVDALCRAGLLTYVKIGRLKRFFYSDIDAMLAQSRIVACVNPGSTPKRSITNPHGAA